jgi:predicted ATPase
MHLNEILFLPDAYPPVDSYPFNLDSFKTTGSLSLRTPVTFFIGENGTGKSTLLRALAYRCGIHIWEPEMGQRYEINPYEDELYRYIRVEWADGMVPGSFFASEIFQNFARFLDEWAVASPRTLEYFGGSSLMTQSHGQCHMAFFSARFSRKGIYILDEPENALSPATQLDLLRVLDGAVKTGNAQFIIATHSPLLLALPGATIYSFDASPITPIDYEETEHFRIYRDFLNNRERYMQGHEWDRYEGMSDGF